MRLTEFKVLNYRSIDDSGPIKVKRSSVLMGRNESGKSNLLRALYYLRPSDKKSLPNSEKDFPLHRKISLYKDSVPFIHSTWELNESEQTAIVEIFPRINNSRYMHLMRKYSGAYNCNFSNMRPLIDPSTNRKVKKACNALLSELRQWSETLEGEGKQSFREILEQLEAGLDINNFKDKKINEHYQWADSCTTNISNLLKFFIQVDQPLPETTRECIEELESIASYIKEDRKKYEETWNWVRKKIPTFIYIEEYPKIDGEYNLREFLDRREQRKQDPTIKFADDDENKDASLTKLCKVAGIRPEDIHSDDASANRTRERWVSDGEMELTKRLNALWHNTQLEVILKPDGDMLNVYIKSWGDNMVRQGNPTKVHLDQKSLGFRWFFDFYVTFASDTDFGRTRDRILLLDEPGLHLHGQSQYDLLQHFKADFENQIIYTTHSPFMMSEQLGDIRFVALGENGTTKVRGDYKTNQERNFPDEIDMGFNLNQSRRITPYLLIVEGFIDVCLLRAVSSYLLNQGKVGIRRSIAIKHAEGVDKIKLFAAGLFAEKVGVMALLDHEEHALREKELLLLYKLIREENIVTVVEAFGEDADRCADIEDILGDELYGKLVRLSHEKFSTYEEKNYKKVEDTLIEYRETTRIVKRYQAVFKKLNLKWDKVAPIETFCELMLDSQEASKMISGEVEERFTRLFERINQIKNTEA